MVSLSLFVVAVSYIGIRSDLKDQVSAVIFILVPDKITQFKTNKQIKKKLVKVKQNTKFTGHIVIKMALLFIITS